jgi:hypothetical protein
MKLKHSAYAVVAISLALSGCPQTQTTDFRLPDPTRPQIVLSPNGYLVVNQEPIVFVLKANEPTVITWRLPPGSGLTFDPNNGIMIVGRIKDEKYDPIALDDKQNVKFNCVPGDKAPEGPRAASSDKKVGDTPARNLQAFTCTVNPTIQRGQYTYYINVAKPGGGRIRLDPSLMPSDSGGG